MGQTAFKDSLKVDPSFWLDRDGEWGKGPGYKNRISNRNQNWFSAKPRLELEKELWEVVTREWATLLAAKIHGRQFVGIELDNRYFETARDRLREQAA
jgi:hypothetical protein